MKTKNSNKATMAYFKTGIFLTAFLLMLSHSGIAQGPEKLKVGIVNFSAIKPDYKEQAATLQDVVTEVFTNNKTRFDLSDRSQLDKVKTELEIQKGYEFLNSEEGLAKQGVMTGANYVVSGNISSIVVTVNNNSFGGITVGGYNGKLSFSLQAIDVATGKSMGSKAFNVEASVGSNFSMHGASSGSAQTNLEKGIVANKKEEIKKLVAAWVNESFPSLTSILAIATTNKKTSLPEEVMIQGGDELYLHNGNTISLYQNETLNGVPWKREVGQLKVVSVEGGVTKCKVLKGADVMQAKINDKSRLEFKIK